MQVVPWGNIQRKNNFLQSIDNINFPGKLQNILYLFSGQFLAFAVLICGTELKSPENACCARGNIQIKNKNHCILPLYQQCKFSWETEENILS